MEVKKIVKLYPLPTYLERPVQEGIQERVIAFKEEKRWLFQPKKKFAEPVLKKYSDERIMLEIDLVCRFSGIRFLTPPIGNIDVWQEHKLGADMLGSRRWLTYFQVKNAHGGIAHPPYDLMRPFVLDGFLKGYDLLKQMKQRKNTHRK